eukprot:215923-Chlamydomonas_euryale.AAC.2
MASYPHHDGPRHDGGRVDGAHHLRAADLAQLCLAQLADAAHVGILPRVQLDGLDACHNLEWRRKSGLRARVDRAGGRGVRVTI